MTLPIADKIVPGGPGVFVVDSDGVEVDGQALSAVLGDGPLIALMHSGQTGASTSAVQVPGPIPVPNSADIVFVFRVGTVTGLFTGGQVRSQARTVDGVAFQSSSGNLNVTGDGTDKAYSVYRIGSISTIQAAVEAAGGGSLIIEDEGTALASAALRLNFTGAGVTVTGTGSEKTITIPGSGAALPTIASRDVGRILRVGSDEMAFWDEVADILEGSSSINVNDLLARAYDLRAGGDTTGWADIASTTVGGISFYASSGTPNLAQAVALTYSAPRITVPSTGDRHGVWRVPEDTDITHWRVRWALGGQGNTGFINSGSWVKIGTQGGWDYYRTSSAIIFRDGGSLDLQTDSSAAHIGSSTFLGNLLLAKVAAALGLEVLTANRGRIVQRKQDETGFEYGPDLGYMPPAPDHEDEVKQYALTMPPVSGAPNWREIVDDIPELPARTLATQRLALRLPASTGDTAHRRVTNDIEHTTFELSPHRGVFEVSGKSYGFRAPAENSAEFVEITLADGTVRKIADVAVNSNAAPAGGMSDGTNHYVWARHSDGDYYLNTINIATGALSRRTGGTGITLGTNVIMANSGAILSGTGYVMVYDKSTTGSEVYRVYSVNLTNGTAALVGSGSWQYHVDQIPGGIRNNGGTLEVAIEGPTTAGADGRTGGLRISSINTSTGALTELATLHNVALVVYAYFGSGWLALARVGGGSEVRFAQVLLTGAPASWQDDRVLLADEAAYDALANKDNSILYLW